MFSIDRLGFGLALSRALGVCFNRYTRHLIIIFPGPRHIMHTLTFSFGANKIGGRFFWHGRSPRV